jgi:hypothetical protein
MKLRKRNLGPILDANGWAVNARARINVPFGTSLTGIAKLPAGSQVDYSDRFAQKSSMLPKILIVAFVAWWIYAFLNDDVGRLYRWTDGRFGKPPVEVQKMLDEQKAADKKAAAEKAAAEKAAAEKAAAEKAAAEKAAADAAAAAAKATAPEKPAETPK